MSPVTLPGYQKFFDSLNKHDRKRVLYLQWELLLADFAKETDFVALLCWHEAIDRVKEYGIGPKKNTEDETPSRVVGAGAKIIHNIDKAIHRASNGEDSPVAPAKLKLSTLRRESDAYFNI